MKENFITARLVYFEKSWTLLGWKCSNKSCQRCFSLDASVALDLRALMTSSDSKNQWLYPMIDSQHGGRCFLDTSMSFLCREENQIRVNWCKRSVGFLQACTCEAFFRVIRKMLACMDRNNATPNFEMSTWELYLMMEQTVDLSEKFAYHLKRELKQPFSIFP